MLQEISNNYNSKYRQSILKVLLKSGVILSSAALLPSIVVAIIHKKYYIGIINILFALIFISLEYFKKLNYITKSVIILLIIYITGINVLFTYGFISEAPYWFFSVAVTAAVLLGLKAALISVITTSITLLTAALLFIYTSFGDELPFFLSKTHTFAAIGNYLILNGTLSVAVAVLLKKIEKKNNSITGRIKDIREKNLLRSKNEQRTRMETVGNMAGSVAHELNNILTGIIGYPDLILMEIDKNNKYYNYIKEIQTSGEKAAEIIQDLLIMSKKGLFKNESFSINKEIFSFTNSRDFLNCKKRKPDSVIKIDLTPENPGIICSLTHFKKSLSNMIQNAFDFIDSDGIIKIRTEIISLSESYSTRFKIIPPGRYVCFSVIDNGSGIREEDVEHVFEPFYTKKVMKKNSTGLGMTVVWGTASECGAFLDISSTPYKETSVQIYFPAVLYSNTAVEDKNISGIAEGNNENVLVVDDMPQQRKLCGEILNKLKYNVTTAESGEKAVEMIKSRIFDLVLLDMIMKPGMDGLDTYTQISKIVPDQKTAVLSGYSESDRLRILTEKYKIPYLKKPYTITQLAELTAGALKESPSQKA